MVRLPIPKIKPSPTGLVEKSFGMLIESWKDYKKTCEIEATKREYIQAQKEVSIERIRAQRSIMQQYLSSVFEERKLVIEGMFDQLDKGLETGNDKLISVAMNTIIATVQTSPLQGAKELFQAIDDNNVECIEI